MQHSWRRRYSGKNLARVLSIEDLRQIAHKRLPRFVLEYLEGGAEDEATLAENRAAFARYKFLPRTLVDVSTRSLETNLFGKPASLPFAISPTGFNGLLWPQGDRMLAEAAAQAGIPFGQSTVSNAPLVDLAAIPGLHHWFQLYVLGPDRVCEELIERAHMAGSEALLVTTDVPVYGNREWDFRSYARTYELTLGRKIDVLMHPRWLWATMLRNRLPTFSNIAAFLPAGEQDVFSVSRWLAGNERPDLDWRMLARIRKAWPGKLVVKGVLCVDDALKARDAGADGIVLTNHGGRQLDGAIAPIDLIAPARKAVGRDLTILADSGFRRGSDIVKALALGADAALIGRATLYGLAARGKPGVTRAIEILTSEIDRTMALLGARAVGELVPEMIGCVANSNPGFMKDLSQTARWLHPQ